MTSHRTPRSARLEGIAGFFVTISIFAILFSFTGCARQQSQLSTNPSVSRALTAGHQVSVVNTINARRGLTALSSQKSLEFYAIGETAFEVRAVIGTSVVCATPNPDVLLIPPMTIARGDTITKWYGMPHTGDSVMVSPWNDEEDTEARPQVRALRAVYGVSGETGCSAESGLVEPRDSTRGSYLLTVAPSAAAKGQYPIGTPVRVFRRVHYELYRGADRRWYLGYFDCQAGRYPVCGQLEPVGGPFGGATDASGSGPAVHFTYLDAAGQTVEPTPESVRRITGVRISARKKVGELAVLGSEN